MKAIWVTTCGGPEVMTVADRDLRAPGPGEVEIKVRAAGVNFIDIYQRTGLYKVEMPWVPGLEGCGEITALGEGVTDFSVGQRVAWASVSGSYAERVIAPVNKLVAVPDGLSDAQAAAAMLQGMTAQFLATSTYPLKPGDSCVIHAAAGGVGLLLCQMAHNVGARVVGVVSTEAKAKLATEAGADAVVLSSTPHLAQALRAANGGEGFSVVYDSVGKDTFVASLDALKPRGMMALYGQSSGPVPPFDPQWLAARGSLFFTRPSLFHYTATRDELVERSSSVLGQIARGDLRLTLGAVLPLEEAAEAHRRLAARETTGKLILSV